jgi:hypothetical protein
MVRRFLRSNLSAAVGHSAVETRVAVELPVQEARMRTRRRMGPATILVVALAGPTLAGEESMSPDREIAEALLAGPESIREEAGVLVLGAEGYEAVRESRNGFHCLIGRSVPGSFEPMCFDAEGSETLMQAMLLEASLQAAGLEAREVERELAAAWSDGRLRPPRGVGINFMLSPRNRVPVDTQGTVRPYRPHVMVYAPYLTGADFGAGPGNPVFVINEGGPGAYLIVPVPEDSLSSGP